MIIADFGASVNAVQNVIKSISEQGSRGLGDPRTIEALANSVSGLTAKQQAYVIATQTGNQAVIRQVLETNKLTESEINNAMAKVGLMNATRSLNAEQLQEALTAQLGNKEKAKELTQTISLASAREMEKVSLERLTYAQFQASLTAKGLTQQQALAIGTALGYSGAIDTETIAVNDLSFATLSAKLNQLGYTQEQIKATGAALGFSSAATAETLSIQGLTYAELQAKLQQAGLNVEQAKAIGMQLGYSGATVTATTATLGFTNVLKFLKMQLKSIGITLKALVMAHPIIAGITAAVTAGVIAWKIYKNEQEEAQQAFENALEKIKERRDALEEEVSDIQSVVKEYEVLGKKTNLTSDEKKRLVELQDRLNKSYDTELKGIDLVNGKYNEQIEKIRTLNKEKQKELLRQSRMARYAAETVFNTNSTDVLIDKQIAKSIDKDFADGYSEFIEAVFKRNIKGVSFENGNIIISDSLNSDEKVKALKEVQEVLDRVTTSAQKSTDTVVLLNGKINSLIEDYSKEVDDYNSLLDEETLLIINNFEHNGETVKTLTEENALAWKSALINEFAKDDPELRKSIDHYYHYNIIPYINRGNEEVMDAAFDWSSFADEHGLDDIEKLIGKIQTAYKNLEETGNGFTLDSDILGAFPELSEYLDDTEKLKEKLQELANAQMQPLIDDLEKVKATLSPTSAEYDSIRNLIKWLQQQADVTAKVKEKATKVSDLYKDQKLQIHENIQALEREVKTIDKQIDALEKKKDLQEKYIKTLEKEKDRLEDLIDDYETAASVVKDYIDEQNDGLEKQKDKIEERYDTQIKAIEETYDKQVKLIEAQEEGFDKQIKALQDEADEQDRLNKLKEKELALEKAKNEKVRVYTAERGWIRGLPRFIRNFKKLLTKRLLYVIINIVKIP